MKKIYALIVLLLLSFAGYLYITNTPRDYTIEYNIINFRVREIYNHSLKNYIFLIEYEDITFPLIVLDQYSKARNLVSNIDKYEDEDTICIGVTVNDNLYPICHHEDSLIDFRLIPDFTEEIFPTLFIDHSEEVISTFESLKIYNYLDNSYYIWNYKGYYYINSEFKRTYNLIDTDNYNNALGHKINNFLITPNYDKKFYFNEYFILNNKNSELSSFKLGEEISYNSYYLGNYNDDVHLVDKKSKKQYKINIRRKRLQVIGTESRGGTWYNNGWESISLNRLVNREHSFIKDQIFNYELVDGTLYYLVDDFRIKVSSNEIKHIVYINHDEVYYIVNNILYMYSPYNGEVKLIESHEWNFNYQNKIFIFK